MMLSNTNRRRFMQTTAAVGAGFWVAGGVRAEESTSPNEQIQFACIGIGGKGGSDSADAARHGKVVAVVDVDQNQLDSTEARFEDAKQYYDFRTMFDEMGDKIDAVTVSTPDHTHAVAAVMGMKLGKHCFCQKPLTHSIYEARLMGEVAREKKLATQMGNQGTAMDAPREAAAMIRAGMLGKVSEIHIWTNRPIWAQGGARPEPAKVPDNLHWEEFLGPAPERPYSQGYHPFAWRGWWDFGTGALGDMACHTMNLPYMGLDLRNPLSVEAETSGHNRDSYPKWSLIKYEFGQEGDRAPLTLYWYDGGKRPSADLLGRAPAASGALIVGEDGKKLYTPDDYGAKYDLLGGAEKVKVDFPKSPGHFTEWVEAIKGGPQAMSNFPDYSGPMTEMVLLGNLAVWKANEEGAKATVEWDAKNLTAKGDSELDAIIKRPYREGYSL